MLHSEAYDTAVLVLTAMPLTAPTILYQKAVVVLSGRSVELVANGTASASDWVVTAGTVWRDAGNPTSLTPDFVGQEYQNSTDGSFWIGSSLTVGGWQATSSGGGIESVDTIADLKAIDTSTLSEGDLRVVRQPDGVTYNKAAIYGYVGFPDIPSDRGTLLIRPTAGSGYWVAINRTEFSTSAPSGNLGSPALASHLRWIQKLSTPTRYVFHDWDPIASTWIKSGPVIVASGAPGLTGDFSGQFYQDSSNGDTYVWKGATSTWALIV